jgi:hypothetical protein
MKNKKSKTKEILFKSTTKGKNINVLVSLPSDYKKSKLPGLTAWVTALNSGNYRQNGSSLCKKLSTGKLGYCCLGVLSKTQGRLITSSSSKYEKGDGTDVYNLDELYLASDNPVFNILGSQGYLPKDVFVNVYNKKELAIDGTPVFHYNDAESLIALNDDLNLSFKDIAKVLKILYKP